MEHPVNDTLAYVILLAFNIRNGDIPAAILAVLIELGFQSSVDGFGYLRKAIYLKYQNPDMRLTEIYQEIVQTSSSVQSPSQVEQAILAAIENAWRNRNLETWDYFFSEKRMGKRRRPTNKEFICQMACFMELWDSHCREVALCRETI